MMFFYKTSFDLLWKAFKGAGLKLPRHYQDVFNSRRGRCRNKKRFEGGSDEKWIEEQEDQRCKWRPGPGDEVKFRSAFLFLLSDIRFISLFHVCFQRQ